MGGSIERLEKYFVFELVINIFNFEPEITEINKAIFT